jgi:hypothetical protein
MICRLPERPCSCRGCDKEVKKHGEVLMFQYHGRSMFILCLNCIKKTLIELERKQQEVNNANN